MIETPIVILAYARPKQTRELIHLINSVSPRKVYFFVDFPNSNDNILISLNNEVKDLANCFSSNCKVEKVYFESNLGPWNAYMKALDYVFLREDRLIFLEDDKLPSKSFFRFCEDLLYKYKDERRVSLITGLNKFDEYPAEYEYPYFFASNNHHEGHAMWKRTFLDFQSFREIYENHYYNKLYKRRFRSKSENKYRFKQLESYYYTGKFRGAPASMEFFNHGPIQFLNNSLVIVPTRNLIKEVGATEYTVHGDTMKLMTKRQQRLFFRDTFELEFPMKHPKFIIEDYLYFRKSKYEIIIDLADKVERVIRILIYKGPKALISKIQTKIKILLNRNY
jgi:hypothetical protein